MKLPMLYDWYKARDGKGTGLRTKGQPAAYVSAAGGFAEKARLSGFAMKIGVGCPAHLGREDPQPIKVWKRHKGC